MWAFSKDHIGEHIWSEILSKLMAFETQTWKDILIVAKTNNHSINVSSLNKKAQDRLNENHIEAESIISLRLSGNHRLYGYMTGRVFIYYGLMIITVITLHACAGRNLNIHE